jgi:hypothetical protein
LFGIGFELKILAVINTARPRSPKVGYTSWPDPAYACPS